MPRKTKKPTFVLAVRVTSPGDPAHDLPQSGPDSFWQIQWEHRGLFGPHQSNWYVIKVPRWLKLDVWVRIPEGADLYQLNSALQGPASDPWWVIPYGNTRYVRSMQRNRCRTLVPRTACDPKPADHKS